MAEILLKIIVNSIAIRSLSLHCFKHYTRSRVFMADLDVRVPSRRQTGAPFLLVNRAVGAIIRVAEPSLEGPPNEVVPDGSWARGVRAAGSAIGIDNEEAPAGCEKGVEIDERRVEVGNGVDDIQARNYVVVAELEALLGRRLGKVVHLRNHVFVGE